MINTVGSRKGHRVDSHGGVEPEGRKYYKTGNRVLEIFLEKSDFTEFRIEGYSETTK